MAMQRMMAIWIVGSLPLLMAVTVTMSNGNGSYNAYQSMSSEARLAERYAPIAELRTQSAPCDHSGEAYFPAPVELVLGNPDVALKHAETGSSKTDPVVTQAPTAQDLAGKDERYYLDFPGEPNRPRCAYESRFRSYAESVGAKPTAYGRVVVDPLHRRVVLQYWLWYFFNDWNNTHESDWEMVQLVFDAATPEEALGQQPIEVGYAQHGGGELAEWNDGKLQKVDSRIVIHPGAGSHGTYFNREIYIGWGENGTGFGCDNTSAPTTRVPLEVVLIPNDPGPDGPFGWLLYEGQWGERQSWEFNGPQGPNVGTKWKSPIAAMRYWRDTSLAIPASQAIGPTASDLFCSLSAGGSKLIIRLWTNPIRLAMTAVTIIAGIGALFFLNRQALGEAIGFYRRHLVTFVGIGSATIPIGIAFNLLAIPVRENPPLDWVLKWLNDSMGARLTVVALVGGLQQLTMIVLVAPPIIVAIREIQAGRNPGVIQSFRRGYARIGPLVRTLGILLVVVAALTLFVVGIPAAVWLAVRWQFFGQAVILDDVESARTTLRRSGEAVAGHWWPALGDSLLFQAFALIPGPLVGVLLMILGRAAVDSANAFSSVVFAMTVPVSVIGLTFAYQRYRDRVIPARNLGQDQVVASIGEAPA